MDHTLPSRDAALLQALGIRVARGDIDERALWVPSHRILIVDTDVTLDQILALASGLLVVAG